MLSAMSGRSSVKSRVLREQIMKYESGDTIRAGDLVTIDDKYEGQVVASMDTSEYLPGYQDWAYLRTGIMVVTDFAGLVHYTSETTDKLLPKVCGSGRDRLE